MAAAVGRFALVGSTALATSGAPVRPNRKRSTSNPSVSALYFDCGALRSRSRLMVVLGAPNVALTDFSPATVTVHVSEFPVQAPSHPVNVELFVAVAVST